MPAKLQKMLDAVRNTSPDNIAREISEVQPMDNVSPLLYNLCKTEEELIKEGFKPISSMGLLWIKNED